MKNSWKRPSRVPYIATKDVKVIELWEQNGEGIVGTLVHETKQ